MTNKLSLQDLLNSTFWSPHNYGQLRFSNYLPFCSVFGWNGLQQFATKVDLSSSYTIVNGLQFMTFDRGLFIYLKTVVFIHWFTQSATYWSEHH